MQNPEKKRTGRPAAAPADGPATAEDATVRLEQTEPVEEHHDLGYDPHGWGDLRTWFYISVLVFGLIITTVIIFVLVGRGRLTEWNLGWPPTAPYVIDLVSRFPL